MIVFVVIAALVVLNVALAVALSWARRDRDQALGRELWWIENHADDVVGERVLERTGGLPS